MRKALLFLSFLIATFTAQSQILLSESFDGTMFPPTGWTTGNSTGPVWTRITAGIFPAQLPHSGAGEADFNSFSVSSGSSELRTPVLNFNYPSGTNVLSFWMYRDSGYPYSAFQGLDSVTVYVNTTNSATGGYMLINIPRNSAATPSVPSDGWYQYTVTIPASYSSATNYIIFKGISQYGNDIYLDDVNVTHLAPCTGTPSAGIAFAIPNPVCPNSPITLNDTAYTVASGIHYQWQSGTSATGPWTNIAGATTVPYIVTAGITATTYYRLVDTCVASSGTAISNVITENVSGFISCYCTSAAQSGMYDNIGQVVVGSFANPSTAPTPILSNSTAVNAYTDYTSLGPINMVQGVATPFNVTQIEHYSFWSPCSLSIYIDYNHDGIFQASELVYSLYGPSTQTTPTFSGTITVPFTALPGVTRARFILSEYGANPTLPCGNVGYYDGETEDYNVNVIVPVPCSGTPSAGTAMASPNPVCPNIAFALNDTGYTIASGMNYQWQSAASATGPWTNVAGATTSYYVVAAGITATTYYRFRDSCLSSNGVAYSNVTSEGVNSFINCYCTSAATQTGDDDIGQVNIGSFSNPTVAPTPIIPNSSSVNTYTNFTSAGPIQIIAGASTSLSVVQIESNNWYTCYLKVYIDLNHDGVFGNGTPTYTGPELVYSAQGPSSAANPAFSGTFTVPTTALTGQTRMRFTLQEFGSATSVGPCNSYSWGETEDYTALIVGTPPAPVVTSNSPVCPGTTLTVTATTTAPSPTFTLTGPGIASPGITNSTGIFSIPNASAANAGNDTVIVHSFGFNSPAGLDTVVVYPVVGITSSNITSPTACQGSDGSFQINGLLSNTNYTLRYKKNGTLLPSAPIMTTAAGSYVINNLTAGVYDSIYVVNATSCASNKLGPITISDPNPPATPTPIYTSPVCLKSTLMLNVSNPNPTGNYYWSGPGGYSATPPTGSGAATRANVTNAFAGNYSVYVVVGGCQSAAATVNVAVTQPDPVPTANNVTYCQLDVATPLTATGQGTFNWYLSAADTLANPNGTTTAPIPSTLVAGTFVFYVSQTINCPSNKVPLIVTIKPKPVVPTAPNTSIVYCQYDHAVPLVSNGPNPHYYYTVTGGAAIDTTFTPPTNTPGTFFYYVSQTVNGCESDRLQITVIIKPKPAPPTVVSPQKFCQYAVAYPAAAGQNLKWYLTPTGPGGSPAPLVNTSNEDSFYYYVTQTINGCESDRAQIHVVVNYTPNGIVQPDSQYVCQHFQMAFHYFGNARPDAFYNWHVGSPAGQIISGQGTQNILVEFDSAGIATVSLTVNNKGCLSNFISLPVTVRPAPYFTFVSKHDVCENEVVNISLSGYSSGIQLYNYNFGGNVVYGAQDSGPYGVTYSPAGQYVVSVIAVTNNCPSRLVTDTINVHPTPDAQIQLLSSSVSVCSGDSVHLAVNNDQDPYSHYKWTPRTYFVSRPDSTPAVYATPFGSGAVKVQVTSSHGCIGTDSIEIMAAPCCSVYFPSAFSPNGDGLNDVFRPITQGHHVVKSFRVVNRWGQTVFETRDERKGWDGTFNEVPQDMGTYYYYISYECDDNNGNSNLEQKGEFILMR